MAGAGVDLPPMLKRLADRLGIVGAYWDLRGTHHPTSAETARALCAAMGHDADDESSAERAIACLDAERARRCIEPVRVLREHAHLSPDLLVVASGGATQAARVRLEGEGGDILELEVSIPAAPRGRRVRVPLPVLEPGDYQLALSSNLSGQHSKSTQRLVVAPRSALTVRERLGETRARGVWTNLYSVRSASNWGFGDLADLSEIAAATAVAGGDFVGLNPLHAIPNRPGGVSPYSPISRYYRNSLYIAIECVPEYANADAVRARVESPSITQRLAQLRSAERIDHAAVVSLKLPFLRELFALFDATPPSSPRRQRYATFRKREGQRLVDFATFELLMAGADGCGERSSDFRSWPEPLRAPHSPAVAALRDEHAREIEFRCWLQFEIEEQLGVAAARMGDLAGRIGLYGDLAVGSAAGSADAWMAAELYASGVSVGAPPDEFAPDGQNWGLPPLDPHGLRRGGHREFSELLDSAMRHTGALRIDHVMGFMRQFWIPDGSPASDGAYVRYPLHELLGLVALASRRHGTLVIGEDLGTVPPTLGPELASWGILSSCVLLFERDDQGFRPPEGLSNRALASVNTHDLAPVAGYLSGRDLRARHACGGLDDARLEAALTDRDRTLEDLFLRLRSEGIVEEGPVSARDLSRLLTRYLERSPAPLLSVSLDDLAGETEPINLPGVASDIHPSWERRMNALMSPRRLAEQLAQHGFDRLRRGAPGDPVTSRTVPPESPPVTAPDGPPKNPRSGPPDCQDP